MSDLKKNKHMTLEDRIEIQNCLDHGMTFKAIAARIGKDQTTVSKEVKKHRVAAPYQGTVLDDNGEPTSPPSCPDLIKAPFVCNPCKKRHSCRKYQRELYIAKKAQSEYEELLSESREGIPLNKESFYEMDAIIAKGIRQGQHLYHISQTHELGVSKSSIYRHLDKGYLSISKMDLPRAVKFKRRKTRPLDYVPKSVKVGRAYDDKEILNILHLSHNL